MITVIGVKFRTAGKIYYFNPAGLDIQYKDHVIVETARGVEYGTVVLAPRQITDDMVVQPLKPVLRIATKEDDAVQEENAKKEAEAYKICQKKILEHGLEMKLIETEYTFDNNKLLFYFTADGRIDFRALVKDLASVFRTRIELRQIGVRDETKLLGGLSVCGRPLCCHTYLTDFVPVSIKMAKEQNLSLNPTKISGVCGRLMCCLKNEEEAYEYLNANLPAVGSRVTTLSGLTGEVQSVSVLKQRVKLLVTSENDVKEVQEYPIEELRFNRTGKHSPTVYDDTPVDDEELQVLELLDKEEHVDSLDPDIEEHPKQNKETTHQKKHRDNKNYKSKNYRGGHKEKPRRDTQEKREKSASDEKHAPSKGRYNNHHNSRGNRNNGRTGHR